jgi:WD40 repeat protein
VTLWDVKSGVPTCEFKAHRFEAKSVVFFANNRGLISAGWDGRIMFWDVGLKKIVHIISEVPFGINALSLSNDETRLAVGDYQGLVTVWDINGIRNRLLKK